jgi:hypothetical protein
MRKTRTRHSLEDLGGIRDRVTVKGRKQRARHANWSFHQLRKFISYKKQILPVFRYFSSILEIPAESVLIVVCLISVIELLNLFSPVYLVVTLHLQIQTRQ